MDATQTEIEYRQEYIAHSKKYDAEVIGYVFDTPLEVAWERNQTRNRVVPEVVIKNMHQRLKDKLPTLAEGFDKLYFV